MLNVLVKQSRMKQIIVCD